jgi:broad specificity phosphatase PhoE
MKPDEKNYCTIYLVRHGETEWNKKGIVMGQSDSPLTETGIEQVKATARELKDVNFDAIFSSDLHRAERTAEIIKLERQIAVQTSKALRERAYGHYEGTSSEEYGNKFQASFNKLEKLTEQERNKFKFDHDIESDEEVIGRMITQLREIAVAYPGKNVLVVGHGSCIRTFLTHTGYVKFGELKTGAISNGSVVVVLCDGIDFFIKEAKGIKKS